MFVTVCFVLAADHATGFVWPGGVCLTPDSDEPRHDVPTPGQRLPQHCILQV